MILLGIDLGSVSVTAAVLAVDGVARDGDGSPNSGQASPDQLSTQTSVLRGLIREGSPFVPDPLEITLPDGRSGVAGIIEYRRTRGRPFEAARDLLERVVEALSERSLDGVRVTGSGSELLHASLGLPEENEFRALAAATAALAPATRTLVEIGGESSKILFFEPGGSHGGVGIADYATNGDCAAGTGSFLDQQAGRLQYAIEDVGEIAAGSERAAKIAGRCSVFAKSDMIHAQQKGYLPPEVLRGLCETVARNFRSGVAKGRIPQPPVLFVGGVAANRMVAAALREVFELPGDLVVPSHYTAHAALGCALREAMEPTHHRVGRAELAALRAGTATIPRAAALSMEKVILLRDHARSFEFPVDGSTVDVALGIDIGSVSTNLVILDREGRIVREIYTRTQARPVDVVKAALHELHAELGDRVRVVSVGTTGSGRELIGELVGADTINDEITAHKTGADFVARTILDGTVETIFEIGGQDAKYIRIEDGIVVDFAMNEACAAGTGSFLEERAEELGVCIKGEFAERALRSTAPVRLGERCTVFMERDVNAWQQRGARTDDLLAGLAISVATNYINRVVRGRKITGTVFFQGGTAYNDAVAAAFAQILGREIVVPPHNGVIGAIGAALLAWERETAIHAGTRFRGWDLGVVDYRIREFTCRACENRCDIQEFTVEGEKTFWGDQCGDRYRRRARTEFHPVIDDLVHHRREWLLEGYEPGPGRRATAVMPRTLYHYERFPYWNAFFRELGIGLLLTPETTRAIAHQGIEASVAEPCFPIQVAHGHMAEALAMEADFVFLPNYVNAEATHQTIQSFYCPWGMALPFVVKAATGFESKSERILHPLVRFRGGRPAVATTMHAALKKYGVRRGEVDRALVEAEAALDRFRARIRQAGREAMEKLDATGEPAVLLVGRPYNLFDPVVNIDIPRKLRAIYGANVLPLEFLAADDTDLEAINANMFWSYGRKILAGAREAGRHERLHLIYLTNFKCGPDSYIKQFVREAFGRPFLTLQFDGHANDAGMLTRVEAFLDSQGILRRWAHQPRPAAWEDDESNRPAVPPLGMAPISAGCACSAGCAADLLCAQARPAEVADPEAR